MKSFLIAFISVVLTAAICIGGMLLWKGTGDEPAELPTELPAEQGKAVQSVASVQEIRDAFKDQPDLCVYDLSQLGVSDLACALCMDGETMFTKPMGYEMSGKKSIDNTEVSYRIVCEGKAMEYITADEMPYRGVPLVVERMQQPENCKNQSWRLTFPLKGYSFCVYAAYSVADLDSDYAAYDKVYNETYDELVDIAMAVIDSALGAGGD